MTSMIPRTACAAVAVALSTMVANPHAGAQSIGSFPHDTYLDVEYDSGVLANPTDEFAIVYSELVVVPDAAWQRLYFDDSTLRLPRGGFIRVTSVLDGEAQELDANSVSTWSMSTAYFNGNALLVELVAAPGTDENRVAIERIGYEVALALPEGSCGICGADNRVPSFEDYAARLMPVGCSSTVYSTTSCFVSAGHCMQSGLVAQFNVPESNPNCSLNSPPVADQFPLTDIEFSNTGVGGDWAVFIVGDNNLGQQPYDRYGVFLPIAQSGPSSGQFVEIWGYGIDNQCTRNQVQQYSSGSITGVFGSFFEHNADATFGNSGSALVRGDEILGINTHCPCNNVATRVDLAAFEAARIEICGSVQITGACCLVDGTCGTLSSTECANLGGAYQGDGSECPSTCNDAAACCIDGVCFEATAAFCQSVGGEYLAGETCGPGVCGPTCQFDLDGDTIVGFGDLLVVLSSWGPCAGCPADFDGNNDVGFSDLLALLAAWGPCP